MYDYSQEINSFFTNKVKLSDSFKQKLYTHRKANRDRLISRLPDAIDDLTINSNSFKPQGSMAMRTIIQTKFDDQEYDIDDGLILDKEELVSSDGIELTISEVRDIVLNALKDDRFVKQPCFCTNCIRVFYSESDQEKHHVDFPIYRKFKKNDEIIRELANEEKWIKSNPTQVNNWFESEITDRNASVDGKGSQLRILIQLLKRFAKSRKEWDLPNGFKLTMLAVECQKKYSERIDVAFRNLINEMKERLTNSKVIHNLAHPDKPSITRTNSDSNVEELLEKITIALEKLTTLDEKDCNSTDAQKVWDWIFKSDGYFKEIAEEKEQTNSFASKRPDKAVDLQGGGRFG